MTESKRFSRAMWQIMEQLLENDNLEEGLFRSLETIVQTLKSEAGAIWVLDKETDRLSPLFHTGPADLTGVSIENGQGVAGMVTKTGKAVIVDDTAAYPGFEGSIFDDNGIVTKSMLCVPLNNLHETLGCVQVVNSLDGTGYDEEEQELCERMASLAAISISEKGLGTGIDDKGEVLISLRNVTKEFPSGGDVLQILKGINLDIRKNEFLVILGESGCGKSTMLNIIGGMDSLTDGRLIIEGEEFTRPSESRLTRFRREYVGFIFQAYNLMPNLTALENVRLIAELVADPMSPEEAIARVGLADRGGNYPGQLSGGQQQRVSIARAIVKKPRLILADEPTAALDYSTSVEVLSLISEIVKNPGTTVVMVTHNAEIAKMADRVVKMRGGRIASIRKNMHPLKAEELVW